MQWSSSQGWREVSLLKTVVLLTAVVFLPVDLCCVAAQPEHRLVTSHRPATRWEEAFVSGNGRLGAMLYGDPVQGTLVANHCRLYLPLGSREIVPDLASHLPELRRTIREHGYPAALELLLEKAQQQGFPGLVPTDPFHPALFVHLQQTPHGLAREYRRSEDLRTGEITERWLDGRGEYRRRLFVSRTHNVIVMSLTGPGKAALDCDLTFAPITPGTAAAVDHGWTADVDASLIDSQRVVAQDWVTYHNVYTRGKGGYDAAIRIHTRGGSASANADMVRVVGADEVLLLIRVVPWKTPLSKERSEAWAYSPENPDFTDRVGLYQPVPPLASSSVVPYHSNTDANHLMPQIKDALGAVPTDYSTLREVHAEVHQELFDRVSLKLGDKRYRERDIDELLEIARREQRLPTDLVELMYDAGRYMFISSAGELPPNLQGIWTGTWKPAWSGDFTLDSNLELAIAHAYSANLTELMEGYYRLIESLYPEWRINARRTYGCRGFLTNARASNSALLLHWGDWPGVFWTGGCGWLAHFFYDHWNFTGNDQFLRRRTLPLLQEVAAFYEDFTVEDTDASQLQFIPSYSPESGSGVNATMDVMICREVLSSLLSASQHLAVGHPETEQWKKMLQSLPDYRISDDGILAEWIDPAYGERFKHRHLSHLYACYESVDDPKLLRPKYWRAARKAVRRRVNSGGERSSHGRMHQAMAAAHLGMAELAYGRLEDMATSSAMFSSLMCAHEPGPEIFNVDSNGAIPEIINRMLVRSQPGKLDLLPALPAAWPRGEIRGTRARQQIAIQQLSWNHRRGQIQIQLRSEKNQTVELGLPNVESIKRIQLLSGHGKLESHGEEQLKYRLTLPRDKPVFLSIRY